MESNIAHYSPEPFLTIIMFAKIVCSVGHLDQIMVKLIEQEQSKDFPSYYPCFMSR